MIGIDQFPDVIGFTADRLDHHLRGADDVDRSLHLGEGDVMALTQKPALLRRQRRDVGDLRQQSAQLRFPEL